MKSMFDTNIVKSDAFVTMPKNAQLLYFHLGMDIDCDGFCDSVISTIRTSGCTRKDYQTLKAKRFIIDFPSGICVIKHHWINNRKRSDRYTPTKYKKEYDQLIIKPNGSYTEKDKQSTSINTNMDTNGIPTVNQECTNGLPHINSRSSSNSSSLSWSNPDGFDQFWRVYPRKVKRQDAIKAWNQTKDKRPSLAEVISAVERAKQSDQWHKDSGQFIPYPASWLRGGCWDDEIETSSPSSTWVKAILAVGEIAYSPDEVYPAGSLLDVQHDGDLMYRVKLKDGKTVRIPMSRFKERQ